MGQEPQNVISPADVLKKEKQEDNSNDDINMNDEKLTKRQLLEKELKDIGCYINMDTDNDDQMNRTYQGEHFIIGCSADSPYLFIYDIAWYSADIDDVDNFSLVRQAVNACNFNNTSTLLYTIDEEKKCVNVHTRQWALFGSFIPNIGDYLRARLEDSFAQHHNFFNKMEELRRQ